MSEKQGFIKRYEKFRVRMGLINKDENQFVDGINHTNGIGGEFADFRVWYCVWFFAISNG